MEKVSKIQTDGKYSKDLNLCRYNGYAVSQDSVISGLLDEISDLEVEKDDIFVASFPKSGTTWLQQVVYLLHNQEDKEGEIMEWKFPYLEFIYPGLKEIRKRKGERRFLKTHLPYSFLPKEAADGSKKCKILYIYRNPKDVLVSYYFFARMLSFISYTGTMSDFAWQMMRDKVPYGPYFKHIDEYIEAAKKHPDNVLILKYEDMKADPQKVISQIAKFLQVDVSSEKLTKITHETSFGAMKANPNTNYKHWDDFGLRNPNESEFMRKGQVGDYKNHFDQDLNEITDVWIETNLKTYPNITY